LIILCIRNHKVNLKNHLFYLKKFYIVFSLNFSIVINIIFLFNYVYKYYHLCINLKFLFKIIMIFESIEHARHYAAGNKVEIVIYQNKVIDVTEFKDKHPGNIR